MCMRESCDLEVGAVLVSVTGDLGRSLLSSASESSKQILQQARSKSDYAHTREYRTLRCSSRVAPFNENQALDSLPPTVSS